MIQCLKMGPTDEGLGGSFVSHGCFSWRGKRAEEALQVGDQHAMQRGEEADAGNDLLTGQVKANRY